MSDIIITVDLGTMMAYEIVKDPWKIESTRLEAIKSHVTIEPRLKASDKFSDSAGRFYQGGGATAGFGEPHAITLEAEKRLIKQIAEDINTLVSEKGCEKWFLAADKAINNQILENLTSAVRAKLKKNVSANLTKIDKVKLMSYFA